MKDPEALADATVASEPKPCPTEREQAIAAALDLVAADEAYAQAIAAYHAGAKDSRLAEIGGMHFAARAAAGYWDVKICREYVAVVAERDALMAENERLRAQTEWTDITEKQPELYAWVIAFDSNGQSISLASWSGDRFDADTDMGYEDYRHWMPMPAPPTALKVISPAAGEPKTPCDRCDDTGFLRNIWGLHPHTTVGSFCEFCERGRANKARSVAIREEADAACDAHRRAGEEATRG